MSKHRPTTNPHVEGVPLSYVRLHSRFETPLRLVAPDKEGNMVRQYTQDASGTVRRVEEKQ